MVGASSEDLANSYQEGYLVYLKVCLLVEIAYVCLLPVAVVNPVV